jgi:hypothetical protein
MVGIISYLSATDESGLGDLFNKLLAFETEAASDLEVPIYKDYIKTGWGIIAGGHPNNEYWGSGTASVKVNVKTGLADAQLDVKISRCDHMMVEQEYCASNEGSIDISNSKELTFTFNYSFSSGSIYDRLVVQYLFDGIKIAQDNFVVIQLGDVTAEASFDILDLQSIVVKPEILTARASTMKAGIAFTMKTMAIAICAIIPPILLVAPNPLSAVATRNNPTVVTGMYALTDPLVTTWYSDNKATGHPTNGEWNPTDHLVTYTPGFSGITTVANMRFGHVQIATDVNFDTIIWDSGNINFGYYLPLGTRTPKISIAVNDAVKLQDSVTYYWRMQVAPAGYYGDFTATGTFNAVTPNNWWDTGYNRRANVRMNSYHSALMAGYTLKLAMPTGYGQIAASNAFWHEAIQHSGTSICEYEGYRYVAYLGRPCNNAQYADKADSYVVKGKVNVDKSVTWYTPVLVEMYITIDSHYYPELVMGPDAKLHLLVCGHVNQGCYRRTVGAHVPGTGIDISSWTAVDYPSQFNTCTYIRVARSSVGTIYAFYQDGNDCLSYAKWTVANGWSTKKIIAYYGDYRNTAYCIYIGGIIIDPVTNRCHVVITWHDEYLIQNTPRGVSYIYSDIDGNGDYSIWY